MGVLFRRKNRDKDDVTDTLVHRGVYRLSETYDDEESKKFKGTKVAYSFWSAVKYTFILSFLLWWLPIFGQMIAGYVGGRRAGTPWRGVAAALIPLAVIFIISGAVDAGWIPTVINGVNIAPGALLGALAGQIPVLEPFMNFASMYLHDFIALVQSTISFRLDSYLMTVAFAYVGGIIADQTRREMEYVSRHGSPRTTVVVEGNESPREIVSPRPSWSTLSLRPRHREVRQASFGELQAVNADARFEEMEQRPLRAVRKTVEEDPGRASELSAKERKLIQNRARTMNRNQRLVEKRRIHPAGTPGLVGRAMKANHPRPAHPEGSQQASGDWEYV